jgi:dCMP deaminase
MKSKEEEEEEEESNDVEDIGNEDLHFMRVSIYAALRSKYSGRKIGAALYSQSKKKLISVGWNRLTLETGDRLGDDFSDNNPTSEIHAEENVISYCGNMDHLYGSTLYVTRFPCNRCARKLVQRGIYRIVYLDAPESDDSVCNTSLEYFKEHHVLVEHFDFAQFVEMDGDCSKFLANLESGGRQESELPQNIMSPEEIMKYWSSQISPLIPLNDLSQKIDKLSITLKKVKWITGLVGLLAVTILIAKN